MFDYEHMEFQERFVSPYKNKLNFHYVVSDDQEKAILKLKNRIPVYFRLKRVVDILLSILFIILFAPISIFIIIFHKLFHNSSIFYIQKRVGKGGQEFNLIKFRTMVITAEEEGARFSERDDPRITRTGRFMRRCRIDEIPQLINILKGDMSFIGPRPERKIFSDKLSRIIPGYELRLLLKPGLTGWGQVKGKYAGTDLKAHIQKLKFDLFYLNNFGLLLDLEIILRTVITVLKFKGE